MVEILAGPIIRRTTKQEVNFWLVTSTGCTLNVEIATNVQLKDPLNISSCQAWPAGNQVFVHVLKATPSTTNFPLNTKLYYDITIDGIGLAQRGLTSGAQSITYNDDALPSLIIPSVHKSVIHSSCRKPHATDSKAYKDQVVSVDQKFEEFFSTDQRPTMLCSTGDQIYADDVAAPLLDSIRRKASELFLTEDLPTLKGKKIDPQKILLCDRGRTLKNMSFSSTHAENHLLTFAEYMMMNLYVTGGIEPEFSAYEDIKHTIRKKKVKRSGKIPVWRPVISKYLWDKEVAVLKKFFKEAKCLRRISANAPVYPMFDDHEFTDDWNLAKKLAASMRRPRTLGRRVQCNALTSFLFCHYLGTVSPNNQLLEEAVKYSSGDFNRTDYQNLILRTNFTYSVPGEPGLLVLDTRTHRVLGRRTSGLMNQKAFSKMEAEMALLQPANTLLLVSPAPVYGADAIERLQRLAISLGAWASKLVDGEYWSNNKWAFSTLERTLASSGFADCLIFSGDVHYAFMREGSAEPVKVTQFVSSATHNAPGKGVRGSVLTKLQNYERGRAITPPYLVANNQSRFISGDPNFGLAIFDANGKPSTTEIHFYSISSRRNYVWEYDLNSPRYIK